MGFKFDQPVEHAAEMENAPEGMTFENAPADLKFSDLGPPPERVETADGAVMRREADTAAVWNATCPKCGVHMVGTRDTLTSHECITDDHHP